MYAYKLSEYLRKKTDLPAEIHEYTSCEALKKDWDSLHIGLLVICEEFKAELEERAELIKHIYITTREDQPDDRHYLSKYHSAGEIADRIRREYLHGRKEIGRQDTADSMKIYGVYSPVRRCGKTGLAVTMGQILGETGRTLYINCEDYPGFSVLFPGEEYGKTKLLWGHLMGMFDIAQTESAESGLITEAKMIPEMSRTLGTMEYIPPAVLSSDVRLLRASHFKHLLEAVRATGAYDFVVIDPGDCFEELPEVLSMCSHVFVPSCEGRIEEAKMKEFRWVLESAGWGELFKTMTIVHPPKEDFLELIFRDRRFDSPLYNYVKNLMDQVR